MIFDDLYRVNIDLFYKQKCQNELSIYDLFSLKAMILINKCDFGCVGQKLIAI